MTFGREVDFIAQLDADELLADEIADNDAVIVNGLGKRYVGVHHVIYELDPADKIAENVCHFAGGSGRGIAGIYTGVLYLQLGLKTSGLGDLVSLACHFPSAGERDFADLKLYGGELARRSLFHHRLHAVEDKTVELILFSGEVVFGGAECDDGVVVERGAVVAPLVARHFCKDGLEMSVKCLGQM